MPNIDLRSDFSSDDSYLRAAIAGYDGLIIFTPFDRFTELPDLPATAVYFPNGFGHSAYCESDDCPYDSNIAADQPLIYFPDYISFAVHYDCFNRTHRALPPLTVDLS